MYRTAFYAAFTLFIFYAAPAWAAPPRHLTHRDSLIMGTLRFKLDVGVDYMVPYDASREIRTVSENIYFGVQFFKPVHLSLYGGITTTYGWGNIVQPDSHQQPTTLSTAAFGIGPGIMIRFEPLIAGRFSLSLDAAGALLLYSRDFPAGGDEYDFMSRLGASICYRIGRRNKIALGGRWMHVSNGQGDNQHNPSYNSAGGNISVIHYF